MFSVFVVGCISVAGADLVRVPFKRFEALPAFETATDFVLEASSLGSDTSRVQDVQLVNHLNLQYYGDIQVGASRAPFTVVFDTGSASLWLPNKKPAGSSHNIYNATLSDTHESDGKVFSIRYGSGKVSGTLVRDSILIGDLKLPNFTFAEVNDTSGLGQLWTVSAWDGILGLGWDSLSVNELPTVMNALVASGQLAEPVFGFFLGDDEAGQLVFGGADPEHYSGTFNFVSLQKEGYWQIGMEGVSVKGEVVSNLSSAVVDSGTSMLVGPVDEVQSLMSAVGATPKMVGGGVFYAVKCAEGMPSIGFVIGGQSYALSLEDVLLAQEGSLCYLAIKGMDVAHLASERFWILGDVFMRKYYILFDWGLKRIGIATATRSQQPPRKLQLV